MKKEQFLQLIGIAIFLIVTSLTYGIVTPVKQTTTNTSLVSVTNEITNTTNNAPNSVDDNSRLTNDYRIMIAIAAGVVITVVTVFLIGFW